MLINCVKYVNLFMQTVKMYQLERNLGQLYATETANVMAAHYVYKYNSHIRCILSDIVVVSFTHLKRYDTFSYIQILFNQFIEDYM